MVYPPHVSPPPPRHIVTAWRGRSQARQQRSDVDYDHIESMDVESLGDLVPRSSLSAKFRSAWHFFYLKVKKNGLHSREWVRYIKISPINRS